MQFTTLEITFWSGIIAGIIAIIGGLYLVSLWKNQNTRMLMDLPLVFGISFVVQGVNFFILSSMNYGYLPDTLELFRLRTFVIAGSMFPFVAVILDIWLSKYRRYFKYIMSVAIGYWVVVTLLGESSSMIMILVMPILLFVLLGLVITFAITWRTNRLKEVRSGLMVIALAFIFTSQMTKVSLMAIGFSFIADMLTVVGSVLAILALTNPWKEKQKETRSEIPEIYA
ncbi:MAG: hypothetical protein ACFFEJ_05885 [Candidatus Thorarchaeota archaeon]